LYNTTIRNKIPFIRWGVKLKLTAVKNITNCILKALT
jgi:hypothetical protein